MGGLPNDPMNGATGFPNLTRLTPYHRPPAIRATSVARIVLATGRRRPQQKGTQTRTAIASGAPEYLAPATRPANSPQAAAALRPGEMFSVTAAAMVIVSSSRSSFAEDARK